MAKTRPYLFYDVALTICSTCFQKLEGKIVFQDGNVYLLKRCPEHGAERILIADDIDYYRRCREVFIKPPEMPLVYNTPVKWGCPYDCGLCTDHEQHSCLTLIEICDYCNLRCPVCYAESGPERQQFRSLAQIEFMLDAVVRNEGHPDVVQLSGGEPTLHPDFFTIVEMAKARPIRHLMVNTNGVRIAQDEDFVRRLAEIKENFEVYLQFDSFEREPLMQLRGADLRRVRLDALEKLNRYNISTNLVVTLKKGLNDHEIGKIIDYALQQPCVRGVTFQPIQDAGRVEFPQQEMGAPFNPDVGLSGEVDFTITTETGNGAGAPSFASFAKGGNSDVNDHSGATSPNNGKYLRNFNPATDRLTLTEVRRKILEQTKVFRPEDVIPVPCHPDSLAMAYALKLNGKVTPLTSMIPPEILINGASNTILYEQEPAVRDNLFKLFATNHSPQSSAGTLRELLCCLPKIWIPDTLKTEMSITPTSVTPKPCHSEHAQSAGDEPASPELTTNHVGTAALGCPAEQSSASPVQSSAARQAPTLSYDNIFRVIIMHFLDAHSFDVRSVKKTCVHIAHPDGRLIPFDTYNLFYRDNLEKTRLDPLRTRTTAALTALSS